MTEDPQLDEVPRLPRGRGITLSRPQLVRILGLIGVLVVLLMMQRPCSRAVSTFVTSFGDQGSAAVQMPKPGNVDMPVGSAGSGSASALPGDGQFERLRPGMTEDEIKAVIERARIKAARGSATP